MTTYEKEMRKNITNSQFCLHLDILKLTGEDNWNGKRNKYIQRFSPITILWEYRSQRVPVKGGIEPDEDEKFKL